MGATAPEFYTLPADWRAGARWALEARQNDGRLANTTPRALWSMKVARGEAYETLGGAPHAKILMRLFRAGQCPRIDDVEAWSEDRDLEADAEADAVGQLGDMIGRARTNEDYEECSREIARLSVLGQLPSVDAQRGREAIAEARRQLTERRRHEAPQSDETSLLVSPDAFDALRPVLEALEAIQHGPTRGRLGSYCREAAAKALKHDLALVPLEARRGGEALDRAMRSLGIDAWGDPVEEDAA